jgi:transposase
VKTRDQAERFLRAWVCKAQPTRDKFLLKFVATLLNWWTEILNYFIERVTNGFVEGACPERSRRDEPHAAGNH